MVLSFPRLIVLFASTMLVLTGMITQRLPFADSQQKTEAALIPVERFDGVTTLLTKAGKRRDIHIILRNWIIHPGEKVSRFPETGFMIVQLRAGKVIVMIDGKEQKHQTGEFWAVPASSLMSIQVTSESAVLQTMAVRK